MRALAVSLTVLALAGGPGCRAHQPILDKSEDQTTPGTIAGILTVVGGEPVAGRRVHAVEVATARKHTAVTNVTGGFSIPVPPGRYRLEVDLREGERIVRDPGTIEVHESDLDANREIVIGS